MAISKEVTTAKKEAEFIQSAVETHGARIGEGLAACLSPYLASGETLPDALFLMQLLRRWVADAMDKLVAADEAHDREQGEDAQARQGRDAAFAESRQGTIALKESLSGLHGSDALAVLGLAGDTPDSPQALARVLSAAGKRLAEGQALPPPLEADTPAWTAAQVTARLAALRSPLAESLALLGREEQETKGTLTLKWQAMEAAQPAKRAAAAVIGTFARIAGETDLADRLKPETGRSRKPAEEPKPQPQP
jgi:hypothetical protein